MVRITRKEREVLVAIRHLEGQGVPVKMIELAEMLKTSKSQISMIITGGQWGFGYTGLVCKGLAECRWGDGVALSGTLRLTEAGRAAVRDYALIREKGRYSVGEVEMMGRTEIAEGPPKPKFGDFNPPHPGEIIKELCLEPLGLTVTEAAETLGVSRKTLSAIVNGRAGISPEMAIRLSLAFGTSVESWLNQQMQYDLWLVRQTATSSR